jgi:hypothetical protein
MFAIGFPAIAVIPEPGCGSSFDPCDGRCSLLMHNILTLQVYFTTKQDVSVNHIKIIEKAAVQ